jgi:hypothetical protein
MGGTVGPGSMGGTVGLGWMGSVMVASLTPAVAGRVVRFDPVSTVLARCSER